MIIAVDSLDQHGSIITHLLSQVRPGMDLTKIVLPTFILERRSLLEMFADFLAHPDYFSTCVSHCHSQYITFKSNRNNTSCSFCCDSIPDQPTPQARMVQCLRWYLSAFHAGRRSSVAKKPYNPILGEIFQCYYQLPHVEDAAVSFHLVILLIIQLIKMYNYVYS